jgi:hypothetical protein
MKNRDTIFNGAMKFKEGRITDITLYEIIDGILGKTSDPTPPDAALRELVEHLTHRYGGGCRTNGTSCVNVWPNQPKNWCDGCLIEKLEAAISAVRPPVAAPDTPGVCDCGSPAVQCNSCAIADYQAAHLDCPTCCPPVAAGIVDHGFASHPLGMKCSICDAPSVPASPPTRDVHALVTALEFAKGAIQDAICLEDGLDGLAGEAVIKMINAALKSVPAVPLDPDYKGGK